MPARYTVSKSDRDAVLAHLREVGEEDFEALKLMCEDARAVGKLIAEGVLAGRVHMGEGRVSSITVKIKESE